VLQRRSIRFRLTLWYAVVLTAALGLFGGLLWFSLRHRLLAELDRDLNERTQRFVTYFKSELSEGASDREVRDELNEFCQGLPSSSYLSLSGSNGFVFRFPAGPALNEASRRLHKQFTADGDTFDLEVQAPLAGVDHTLELLRWLLWSLLPAVIGIACLGGWWLSGRALKPVQALTETAHTISVENLSKRLPEPKTGDELARLAGVLNGMLDRLEQALKTLSQFAADASHELRTPLALIRTTAELALRRERPSDDYRASLQEIEAESQRMSALIDDLLTLARGGTNAAEMALEPVDAAEVLQNVCGKLRGLADLREIRMTVSCGRAMISANRAALDRLFLVLIDNAIKYSYASGEVIVTSRTIDRTVEVIVQDFGIGIPPADLPHIFQRFYRADRSRSSAGHGLGLALAESIAQAHGASIQVESIEGAGSKFRVTFPARAPGASENLQVARVH